MMNNQWRDLYKAALLELHPEELRGRIQAAEKAIELKIAEMKQGESTTDGERQEIDDALRGLHVLANTECKPLRAPMPILVRSGVAS